MSPTPPPQAPPNTPIDLRLLTWSNSPHAHTGYGNQTHHLLTIARQLGLTAASFAFYGVEGGMMTYEGAPLYPKGYGGWGDDIAAVHAQHHKADVVLALLDSWVIDLKRLQGQRVALYAPIDHDPCPPKIAERLRECWLPIMYSQYAVRKAAELGIETAYAPHCIDIEAYQPLNRQQARAILGWPENRPIIVTVAANKGYPSRKNWPQMIQAFAAAKRRIPDLLWYCHTSTGEHGEYEGFNLRAEAERHGVQGAITFANQYQMLIGYPDEYLRAVYSAADLFYLPSGGEGFGIPLWESLACGTPVLTTDVTAQTDITAAGVPGFYLPEEACERWPTPLVADQFVPRHEELTRLLVSAVDTLSRLTPEERHERYSVPAREFAMNYSVPWVAERYWRPIFQRMADQVADEGRAMFAGTAQHQRDIDHSLRMKHPADRYAHWLTRWSDIQAHLPALYGAACGLVVELGTRSGVSTAALLAGVEAHGGRVYSIDTDPASGRLFEHIQWRFVHGSSTDQATLDRLLRAESDPGLRIQLLLIDTLHTRSQVEAELALWAPFVAAGGVIAFHDTESFPEVRETVEDWCRSVGLTAEYHSGSNGMAFVRLPVAGRGGDVQP